MKSIIVKPVLTEKATDLATRQVYMFEVHSDASKHQIKQVLESLYEVKIKNVTVMNRHGKMHRVGRRSTLVQAPDRKIAYVSLASGKFEMFPQI